MPPTLSLHLCCARLLGQAMGPCWADGPCKQRCACRGVVVTWLVFVSGLAATVHSPPAGSHAVRLVCFWRALRVVLPVVLVLPLEEERPRALLEAPTGSPVLAVLLPASVFPSRSAQLVARQACEVVCIAALSVVGGVWFQAACCRTSSCQLERRCRHFPQSPPGNIITNALELVY